MAQQFSAADHRIRTPAAAQLDAAGNRRRAFRTGSGKLAAVRPFPVTDDAPPIPARLQDVSAGGIGLVMDRGLRAGQQFMLQPFKSAGGGMWLLYRAVRCKPRGQGFLVGGVLVSAAGDIERDPAGGIAPAELERIRQAIVST